MRAVDQLLLAVVSGEATVIVAMVGWVAKRTAGQVTRNERQLSRISEALERHLSWHDGLDDRNAWRVRG